MRDDITAATIRSVLDACAQLVRRQPRRRSTWVPAFDAARARASA
nr:hypothetical protein [Microbacterium lemovicicum]